MDVATENKLGNLVLDLYEKCEKGEFNIELLELLLKHNLKNFDKTHLEWLLKTRRRKIDDYINNPIKVLLPILEMTLANYELADELGTIYVPQNYTPKEDYFFVADDAKSSLYYRGSQISEHNYPGVSFELTPGFAFDVALYRQISATETSSYERYLFKTAMSDVSLGLYGLQLVYEQLKDKLVQEVAYTSFELPEYSLTTPERERVVTSLVIEKDNEPCVYFEPFEKVKWDGDDYILIFTIPDSDEDSGLDTLKN